MGTPGYEGPFNEFVGSDATVDDLLALGDYDNNMRSLQKSLNSGDIDEAHADAVGRSFLDQLEQDRTRSQHDTL